MFSTTSNKTFFSSSKSKKAAQAMLKPVAVTKPEVTVLPSTAPSTPVARIETNTVEVHVEAGHCHFHRSKALDLYCKVHKEVICSNCLVTRHHDCHKHVEDSSPFQPIEEAASELSGKVQVMIAVEKAKTDSLTEALNLVNSTQEDIEAQVASLSSEVKATRDRIIGEIKSWCEQHMLRLEFVAQCKDEALTHQQELLQPKVDALETYMRNITNTMSGAHSVDEVITVSHRLLEKVSPVTELTFAELETVEKANLVFRQDGKERLIYQIRGLGFSGTPEELLPKPVVVEEPIEEVEEEVEEESVATMEEETEEEEQEEADEETTGSVEEEYFADDADLFSFQ